MKRFAKILSISVLTAFSFSSAMAFENVDFTRAAEQTVNGVVSIKSYATPRRSSLGFDNFYDDPFFEYFFGPQFRQRGRKQQEPKEPQLEQMGLGSGVIIASDGLIVTNNHVIKDAEKLEVTLNDNRTFVAEVIGADPMTDIAVIKIDADKLHVIPMGDSDNLKVGEWVLAVGNPFGLTSTVTAGIVSAKARDISQMTSGTATKSIESYIQTDAAVNPGNSGGALVNLNGDLVGINTAIYSQTGNYAGNSFAIPTAIVQKVVDDITTYGSVQRAVIGIKYRPLTPELAKEEGIDAYDGLYIAEVDESSAGAEAGLKEGDVIVAIDGAKISNSANMQEIITRHRPGDKINMTVIRDNAPKNVVITLRNSAGSTAVTYGDYLKELGCQFKAFKGEESFFKGKRGVQVTKVEKGRFKDAGIKEGFVIFDINNYDVVKPSDVEDVYNSIVESDEYDHVMFITGAYPSTNKKVYYAVDIAE